MIQKQFPHIRVKKGDSLQYLGMELDRLHDGSVQLSMKAYTEKIVTEWSDTIGWKASKRAVTPALNTLFEEDTTSPFLNEKNSVIFHTFTAKGLYLAKRTRSDILTVISILCGRVREPRESDMMILDRVYQYLNGSADLSVVFKGNQPLDIVIYSDASFLSRPTDMMSRTGCLVMVNGGTVATMSNWQKLITKSSTGAEFVALTEATSYALFIREWLSYQQQLVPKIKIMCDNQSVLALLRANHAGVRGTKHLKVRYFFIRQHVLSNEIELVWCKTKDMLADIFTKPVTGQLFKDLISRILRLSV
jgi:hypothetical protein